MSEKLLINQVILKPISDLENGELSNKIIRKCHFCEKKCDLSESSILFSNKLSGKDCFYCTFCLRNNLNTKNNKNIYILSFKNIIDSFYRQNYLTVRKFWLSEINDYIQSHIIAGNENPLFLYDPETMLWFIDFNKIGSSKRKIPIEEILKTIISILTCFNLFENNVDVNTIDLYKNYKSGIENFYKKRQRPNSWILIPPLSNSMNERIKNFNFLDLKAKK